MLPLRTALLLWSVLALSGEALAQSAPKQRGGFKHEPMIFFVAKGAPGACGPGCDTWIAAEGTFDPKVHERLSDFLKVPSHGRLPIFFRWCSPGRRRRSPVPARYLPGARRPVTPPSRTR